jgi:hypothetical protein
MWPSIGQWNHWKYIRLIILYNYSLTRRSIQEYINLREAYRLRAEKKHIDWARSGCGRRDMHLCREGCFEGYHRHHSLPFADWWFTFSALQNSVTYYLHFVYYKAQWVLQICSCMCISSFAVYICSWCFLEKCVCCKLYEDEV